MKIWARMLARPKHQDRGEAAVLILLNYNLNVIWQLLWEKSLQHSPEEGPGQLKKKL